MAKESSFDIVSEPDWSEVLNAIDQTRRETQTRYDFRGHDVSVIYDAGKHVITLDAPEGLVMEALKTALAEKMAKRQVSLKFLEYGAIEHHGMNRARLLVTIRAGIDKNVAKNIQKAIRGLGLKVEAQIQGEAIRVSGKSRDDLQKVIQSLKNQDFGIELVFTNYRTA
ncbi:MAG: YajQ family cyclic di-GMP-binding protein [Firmicutes bacterium]|nr:YajQ family cyclic di-GMP-binding protein [Bacillota bacterium]